MGEHMQIFGDNKRGRAAGSEGFGRGAFGKSHEVSFLDGTTPDSIPPRMPATNASIFEWCGAQHSVLAQAAKTTQKRSYSLADLQHTYC
jgi:hypothetical protein